MKNNDEYVTVGVRTNYVKLVRWRVLFSQRRQQGKCSTESCRMFVHYTGIDRYRCIVCSSVRIVRAYMYVCMWISIGPLTFRTVTSNRVVVSAGNYHWALRMNV